jgi:hypothetical protein
MTITELKPILESLRNLTAENEIVEFKEAKTGYDFTKLGKYFSMQNIRERLREDLRENLREHPLKNACIALINNCLYIARFSNKVRIMSKLIKEFFKSGSSFSKDVKGHVCFNSRYECLNSLYFFKSEQFIIHSSSFIIQENGNTKF